MKSRTFVPTLFLLLLMWGLVLSAVRATSMVVDEPLHIASGYSILRTGDYRLVEEHPPLVKMWAALPLLFLPDIPDPRQFPAWEESQQQFTESLPLLFYARVISSYRPVERIVFPARTMAALFGLLLGAVVYRWTADRWGARAGILALLVLVFDPNILAHSAVACTDLGAAAMMTVALFLFTRWLHRPAMLRLVTAGIGLGLALGTKTSAILLLPIVVFLGIIADRRRPTRMLALIGIAALTLWALYRFEINRWPGIPYPLPAASHLIPWLRLRRHVADGHPAFLLGENRMRGWWYYFPVAFILKTPLPTLLLLALSGIGVPSRPWQAVPSLRNLQRWGTLILFPLIYGIMTLFSPINIGYRHLLPLLPFLFIGIGRLGSGTPNIRPPIRHPYRALRQVYPVLLAWLTLDTLRVAPHYLADFNALAGGPDGGWRYLADSNTDWGQGYKDLARFQKEKGVVQVRLSAFLPSYDPAIYGVVYEPLTPMGGTTPAIFPSRFNPPPGDYIISATTLDGIPLVDPEMYDWFRKREPDARIAHVLFYYRVPPQDSPPRWVAQCTVPVVPLSQEVITEGFGRDDLRLAFWDCTQAWLYPDGGTSSGWYVFYRDPAIIGTPFIRSHLAGLRLSYEQRRRSSTPPFQIYEWAADTVVPLPALSLTLPEGVTSPIALNGPLAFLGASASLERDDLDVETWWQVTEGPITRPLSIMGHLLTAEGEVIGQDDGLGVSPVIWQPGDIIVQRHQFPQPPAGTEPWLRTGVYWLDTMERWSLVQIPNVDIILLPLEIRRDRPR
ncbi:MAG: ArnT family glycosyltransferase [Anaerolineae bacterium]